MTGSGKDRPDVSGSTFCSTGFEGCCIKGGGEVPPRGLALPLGDRDGLRFLSLFGGERRLGDGDRRLGEGERRLGEGDRRLGDGDRRLGEGRLGDGDLVFLLLGLLD